MFFSGICASVKSKSMRPILKLWPPRENEITGLLWPLNSLFLRVGTEETKEQISICFRFFFLISVDFTVGSLWRELTQKTHWRVVYRVGRYKNISLHSKVEFETVKTMAIIHRSKIGRWRVPINTMELFRIRCFSPDLLAGLQVLFWFKNTLAMETELTLKDLLMLFCYIYTLNQLHCCIMHFANSYQRNRLHRLKMFLLI